MWNSAAHGRILVKEINMYVGEKHLATSNKQFVVILLLLKLLQLIIKKKKNNSGNPDLFGCHFMFDISHGVCNLHLVYLN